MSITKELFVQYVSFGTSLSIEDTIFLILERLSGETLQRWNVQPRFMDRKEKGEIEVDAVTGQRGSG